MCEFISSKSSKNLFNLELIWMETRKGKKDGIANLRDELYMLMFWLGTGVS